MSMDEDIAKLQVSAITDEQIDKMLDDDESPEDPELSLEGYTLEAAKLDKIADSLELLRLQQIASAGGKVKGKFKPVPRPKTALQKLIEQRKWERQKEQAHEEMGNFGF